MISYIRRIERDAGVLWRRERERDAYMVGVEAHGWDDGRVRDLRC